MAGFIQNAGEVANTATIFGGVADSLNSIPWSTMGPQGNTALQDRAIRGLQPSWERSLGELVMTGNGLWGKTSYDKALDDASNEINSNIADFSQVNNNANLYNVGLNLQNSITGIPNDSWSKMTANYLNEKIDKANQESTNNFYNQVQRNNVNTLRTNLKNYFAEGGELNGVTQFNEGGTHEQNPFGGIQQGIAADGQPNLVEEGEVKYKDYIYSDRLKASKELLKKNNLPEKYAGKSYAYIANKLQKESEERPNDPISISTLESNMKRLQDSQEILKAKQREKEMAKLFNSLTPEEKMAMLSEGQQEQPQFANGGHLFAGDPYTPSYIDVINGRIEVPEDYQGFNTPNNSFGQTAPLGFGREDYSTFGNNIVNTPQKDNNVVEEVVDQSKGNNNITGINPSLLRYAPAVGSGIGALLAATNGPDYTYANELNNLANQYKAVAPKLVGGYERYTPYDVNLANNEVIAQQAAAQRANRAITNRAAQQAQAIALENAYERANASRNLQWQQANEANRQAIDKYNLGIDQLNTGTTQAYDRLNLDSRDRRLNMLSQAAAARDAADTAWSKGISETSTNFLNQLGQVGKDRDAYNIVKLWLMANPQYATKEMKQYYGLTDN